MNIVFPDRIDLDEKSGAKFKELGVQMYDDTPDNEVAIIDRIQNADIITANFIDITRNVIDHAPNLKFIISSAVGYEWIDYKYASSKGIKVLNCPTQNSEAVAEHAIALMLAVSHRIVEAHTSLMNGKWEQQEFLGVELSGKKLGLVGYGRVGGLVAQKATSLGMQVRHVDSKSTSPDVDKLLSESDVTCLCLPLNSSTRNIINKRRLQLLKPESIFINVARGALVDEAELIKLLQNGSIRGAGLDVFCNEPFTGRAPDSIVEIAKLPNVIATPHMAYNTTQTTERLSEELMKNIHSCINGSLINVVND